MIPSVLLSLALATIVTPEQQVTPPDLVPETSTRHRIDTASNGDGWLTVRGEYGVVASRINRNGDLIERVPIAVGDGGYFATPAVAWGGGKYLVAWTENDAVRAAFIDADGNVSPSFVVSAHANSVLMRQISCAFDGSRFLIVWSESNVPTRGAFYRTKFAALLDIDGNPTATDINLGDGLTSDYFGLAARNNDFLVVTSAGSTVVGFTIDHNARITHRALGTSDTYALRPLVAFHGSESLVLWDHQGVVVRGDGTITPIAPLSFAPATLTAVGEHFIATTTAAGVMRTVVLDENGSERQTTTVAEAPGRDLVPVAAAWNGSALLVAYSKEIVGTGTTYATLVDATGAPINPDAPERAIVLTPRSQTSPAIATADEHDALTVWTEREEASIQTVARAALLRDGVAGTPLDLRPSGAKTSIAFGASMYFVVWSRHDGDYVIEGRRLTRDGTPLDAAPLPILHTNIAQPAAVTFDGENFVVASIIYPSAAGSAVAVRVRPDGSVVDPEAIVLHRGNGFQRLLNPPIIASNGERSIVLWLEQTDLLACSISRDGTPGGVVKVGEQVAVLPSVAWTGATYIVSWTDIFAHALRWTALDSSGNPTGTPAMLQLAAANTIDPTATARFADGALIAWADIVTPTNTDIRALRVAADGSLLGSPFTVAASPLPESAIAASGGATGIRIVYQRAIEFPGTFRLSRVFTRGIGEAVPRRRAAAR